MQMGESIAIIIIVILLVVFGFVFYTKWAQAKISMGAAGSREEDAFAVASIVANLPELHCSKNTVVELACYDLLKIEHLRTMITDSNAGLRSYPPETCQLSQDMTKDAFFFYNSLFKNSRISVYEIYPDPNDLTVFAAVEQRSLLRLDDPTLPLYTSSDPNGDLDTSDAVDQFFVVIYDSRPADVTQKIPARIPIRIYNPMDESVKLGVIEVVRYFS